MVIAFAAVFFRAFGAAVRLGPPALACVLALSCLALAEDKGQVLVTQEQGFARLIVSFPGLSELPPYKLKLDNGILALTFDNAVDMQLPDVAAAIPDYVSVARVDPDSRGLRFGLRTALNFNPLVAGEKLFIDLLPITWQGLPPGLPPEVVAELAARATEAARLAEQKRKADEAQRLKPVATVRVGQNPSFLRLQIDWNVPTKASFVQSEDNGVLSFEWPVPIDIYPIQATMPAELLGVASAVTLDGSDITLKLAAGVKPRFYQESPTQVLIDIDTKGTAPGAANLQALIDQQKAQQAAHPEETPQAAHDPMQDLTSIYPETVEASIKPYISQIGSTVRVVFPFSQDTPSAVFRRGDTVWMMFDTATSVEQPTSSAAFSQIADGFTVLPAGDTQVVRIDLSQDRLATLASEGRAWVLSLGDILLSPTEPMALNRRFDGNGQYEITTDMDRPGRVHQFNDPVVGDTLQVVTAFPPGRAVARTQEFVDFTAMRTVQGLVIKPQHDHVTVAIDAKLAVISATGGLQVSSLDNVRTLDLGNEEGVRGGFVDLAEAEVTGPAAFEARQTELMSHASLSDGPARDKARLELAQFLVANGYDMEAIGVLEILDQQLKNQDLRKQIALTRAIADVGAHRPLDALKTLNDGAYSEQVDAMLWRAIAKVDIGDFRGARTDAMAAENVLGSYPDWVRSRFLMAGIRAGLETNDVSLAGRYMGMINAGSLDADDASMLKVYSGWLSEKAGHDDDALDIYGDVIAADIRPSRAEAVYRTMLVLDHKGQLDLAKATQTLSAEAMLWRGNGLEANMLKFLAELYFRNKEYRLGFETVKEAAGHYPDSAPISQLLAEAGAQFTDLYLNGVADGLDPVDALAIYYDFQQMTPPGARGDEMIRNLARRLVKVDLLAQAAELLSYQIDNRLTGVAQAQVAADLAVIEIADRNPEAALKVLAKTHLPSIAPSLERQRRVLEARAMIDAGRDDLALDMLSKLNGRDVELLRVDAHWQAKRYGVAAEMLEVLYGPTGDAEPLSQPARMSLVKAAVGFVLAGDQLSLSRLRSKFADRMAQSAEWALFDFVTSTIEPSTADFKLVAKQVAGQDSLNAFLSTYNSIYGKDDALVPDVATKAAG